MPPVYAQNFISYPIADLGSCRDARECYLYCQIPENKAPCWSYAKYKAPSNVLGVSTMTEEEKQQMELKARKYNVVFPITELGNCAGPQECRDFCEQSANQASCMNFARKKGFAGDKERPPDDGITEEKRNKAMQYTQSELGCSSMESCRAVCEQNRDKCEAFAKKYGITKEPPKDVQMQELQKTQMLKVARSDLGCTTMETCKAICQEDPKRCMAFARKHGFDQKEEASTEKPYQESGKDDDNVSKRPPCTNDRSCKEYCAEHPNECPGYKPVKTVLPAGGELRIPTVGISTPSAGFVGPNGCRTNEECKQYCQENPTRCPGFTQSDDYKKYKEGQIHDQTGRSLSPTKNIQKDTTPRPVNEGTPSSFIRQVEPGVHVQPITLPSQSGYGGQEPAALTVPSANAVPYQPATVAP